ncbi:putative manganese transporter, partial [Anaerobranca gottschalkii]
MIIDIIELILDSMEGAFIEVGVFVGAVLLFFGYINYKKSGEFIKNIERSKKFQPIIGGLLGLTPGCGGAIFVIPLFFKRSVTFGTVVATLMTTMGDAAFVMIATRPLDYLIVSALMFIVGVTTGYLVDLTPLGNNILKKFERRMLILMGARSKKEEISPLTTTEKITSKFLNYGFWFLISFGLILGILNMMQIDINELFIPN